MIAIADILQAGEKLTAVAPFLAGIQNEEQYTQALCCSTILKTPYWIWCVPK